MFRMLTVMFGLAAACHSKDSGSAGSAAAGSGSGSAGSGSAGSGSAAAVAAMDAGATADATTAPEGEQLPEIADGYGLVVTDPAGGKLPFTLDDGKTSEVADGTLVQLTEWPAGKSHDQAKHIAVGAKQGSVPIANVLMAYEDPYTSIHARSPKGDFMAVMVAIGCGDFCHAALWLLNGPKRHWKVSDNVVSPIITWRPDNGALAFDNGGVVAVVELPSGKQVQELTSEGSPVVSPAYSPSGTLYVRNDDGAVYEVAGGKLKKVGQGRKPKRDKDGMFESPLPVTFDDKGAWKLPAYEQPARRPKLRKN